MPLLQLRKIPLLSNKLLVFGAAGPFTVRTPTHF